MSSFEDAAHLVSWSGLKPRNDESAGKIKSRKITHGNKFLRKTLIECSWAAAKTRGCFYNTFSYHQTVVRRKNKMKVQVAIAEGPDEMMIDAKSIRASYLEQVNAFLKKIGDGVRKTGADYAPMNTKIPFDKALVEYLSRRRSGGR